MIELSDVSKHYRTRDGTRTILDRVNLSVHAGERIGILGKNGSGKSTLIRLISGSEFANEGSVTRSMSVSWPLAFSGGMQGSLTGLDNLRFVCRVYGISHEGIIPFVEEFSELGAYLREPVKNYSNGMRARLSFAISMAIEFDCFLIDEVIAVGDARFHSKCSFELFEKRRDRAMILVSHDARVVRERCHRACVLQNGRLLNFGSINEAFHYYDKYC
ncbi:ABC transporter ATP-binding protein [Paraburkholderia sp. J67]|uniref:ABC transporter ATP-binding protein n=1 Tax=Paraburkholderia sp. J67 TaxID=2805435 RepID=UPI002ABD1861|nr:ABC transporter ATP-binding protein [Paraburkholderia sp. J67]